MPKATLTFKLPEEHQEHKAALEGSSLRAALQDYDNKLRALMKYQDVHTITVEEARRLLCEAIEAQDLSFH